ncbi:MAG: M28 family peptidase, partial [Saprospiraceae bacterium]|nr:M28 family peptidase [Saprospiraceae bacterium]
MKREFSWLIALCFVSSAFAQTSLSVAERLAESITAGDIASYLHVLAADDMEGRETGHPGNTRAAEFIAGQFASFGVPPLPGKDNYYQDVAFSRIRLDQPAMQVNEGTFRHMKDFVVIPSQMPVEEIRIDDDEVVFLGYGIDDPRYSDYGNKDLAGKTILIYGGEPVDSNGINQVTGTEENTQWSEDITLKTKAAFERGVNAVLIIEDDFRELVSSQRRFILGGRTIMGDPQLGNAGQVPYIHISSTVASQILDKKTQKVIRRRDKIVYKGKSKPVRIPADVNVSIKRIVDKTPGVNVCAYIEGTDPVLKDELIVITAHYDHVGRRGDEIFNGADDNASGTSGVMEIAQAFMEAKKQGAGPRRSVLCMLVTGEEKGLLGSQYYSEFPLFPLENTVANINMDMIGRSDAQHADSNYVYVIGSDRLSTELHEINEAMNSRYTGLELDYTYNAKDDPNRFYYRSDHYNFAKHGIPAIFYFSGVHEDYHRPSDTVDKIMFGRAETIARLAFYTGWELAN